MRVNSTGARRLSDILGSVLLVLPPAAWPGPPMVGEDPGILEPGQWEIIAAMNGESRPSIESAQLPVLDVAYGLTRAAAVLRWGERTTPVANATAELPPCEKSALDLIQA